MALKKSYTILTDSREKRPLPIPEHITVLDPAVRRPSKHSGKTVQIINRISRMETGDYACAEAPFHSLIERKGCLREICGNTLTDDRSRFIDCLDRLSQSCLHPYLLLTASPSSLHDVEYEVGLSALNRLLLPRRISCIMVPASTHQGRHRIGTLIAHLLIEGAIADAA